MTSLYQRPDSAVLWFRAKVPRDVAAAAAGRRIGLTFPASRTDAAVPVGVLVGRSHVQVSLKTKDTATARVRSGVVEAGLVGLYDLLRHGPRRLRYDEIVAMAATVSDRLSERFRTDQAALRRWANIDANNRNYCDGRMVICPVLDPADAPGDPYGELFVNMDDDANPDREQVMRDAQARLADWVLRSNGTAIADEQRPDLMEAIGKVMADLTARMRLGAPFDQPVDRITPIRSAPASTTDVVGIWGLFDAAVVEKQWVPSTVSSYRKAIEEFVTHVGHEDAARIAPKDVVDWKDKMLASATCSRRTVADVKLAALKSILALAAANHRIASNPGEKITVKWKSGPGEKMRGHRADDVRTILEAALQQTRPCLKWVPWLMVMTGCRISDAVGIRRDDVRLEEGVWTVRLVSKTAAGDRIVPLHAALIDRGFLDLVRSRGQGYLFFDERRLRKGATAKPGKSVANDVREFVHSLKLDVGMLHRIAPTHGFRHAFTTTARRVGMDGEKREAILGHELDGERGTYGEMAGLAAEIAKLPDPLAARPARTS